MPTIFISYRRQDSADAAGRIYDKLEAQFGRTAVFIDVDSIPPGPDFRRYLIDAVAQCNVLLAIIGRNWLDAADEEGQRRIDRPDDFVRIELEAALERDILVIPVLVGRTEMPSEDELPPSLKEFAYRNAIEVRSGPYFNDQVDRLIRGIIRHESPSLPWYRQRKRLTQAALSIAAAAVVGFGLWTVWAPGPGTPYGEHDPTVSAAIMEDSLTASSDRTPTPSANEASKASGNTSGNTSGDPSDRPSGNNETTRSPSTVRPETDPITRPPPNSALDRPAASGSEQPQHTAVNSETSGPDPGQPAAGDPPSRETLSGSSGRTDQRSNESGPVADAGALRPDVTRAAPELSAEDVFWNGLPSSIRADAAATLTPLKQALLEGGGWTDLPAPLTAYRDHGDKLREFWHLEDIEQTVGDPLVNRGEGQITLPVQLNIVYRQSGRDQTRSFPLHAEWTWRVENETARLSDVRFDRSSP